MQNECFLSLVDAYTRLLRTMVRTQRKNYKKSHFRLKMLFLCGGAQYCSGVSGIPCLVYGLCAVILAKHREEVGTSAGPVTLYFLLREDNTGQ